MALALVSLSVGLAGLVLAGDIVVRAASALGRRFGLAPMDVGVTIVAGGNRAPELAVVFQAIARDDAALASGSIVGSNIANILLVLGVAAAIGTIRVASRAVRLDIPIMIGASLLLVVLGLDGRLGVADGLVMLGLLVGFVLWSLRDPDATTEVESGQTPPGRPSRIGFVDGGTARAALGLAGGVVVLVVAARFVVIGAEDIAIALGVPELIVGLTVVALGTSSPEIATTVMAAVRGERDVAVGNAVGSNIFNILLVLGAAGVFAPGGLPLADDLVELDLPVMVAAAVACLPLTAWDRRLNRWEGFLFLGFYLAYLVFLILDATGHRAKEPFALIVGGFVLPLTVVTAATIIVRSVRRDRASDDGEPVGAGPSTGPDDGRTGERDDNQ